MKSANVAKLKAQLSSYLRAVRHGEEVIVTDRNLPVARIIPIREETPYKVSIRKAPKSPKELASLVFRPVSGRGTDSLAFLLEERGKNR